MTGRHCLPLQSSGTHIETIEGLLCACASPAQVATHGQESAAEAQERLCILDTNGLKNAQAPPYGQQSAVLTHLRKCRARSALWNSVKSRGLPMRASQHEMSMTFQQSAKKWTPFVNDDASHCECTLAPAI